MPRTQAVRIRASAVLARATHQTFSRKWELVVEGSAARGSELSRNRKKSLIPDATASLARIALRAPLRPLFYFPMPARSAGRFSSILSLSPVAWFKCDCQDQEMSCHHRGILILLKPAPARAASQRIGP